MKISVITVCLNCEKSIASTVQSVISQNYSEIEYIVIDGKSNDNTLKILERYSDRIDHLVSEEDSGIFNAMNKGIELSSGDYVIFLNSGDMLFNDSVVENLIAGINNQDIVYADLMLVYSNGDFQRQTQPPSLNRYLFIHRTLLHPATMVKRELFQRYGNFDENYPISSDFEFFLRVIFQPGVTSIYIPLVMCIFDMHGISNDSVTYKLRQRDRLRIQRKHLPPVLFLVAKLRSYLKQRKNKFLHGRLFRWLDTLLRFASESGVKRIPLFEPRNS